MVSALDNAKRVEQAGELSKSKPTEAEAIYKDILSQDPGSSDAGLRDYEAALMGLGALYRDNRYGPAPPDDNLLTRLQPP